MIPLELEDALDKALDLGPIIRDERHQISIRLLFDDVSDEERRDLTARFVDLEAQWAALFAPFQTRH